MVWNIESQKAALSEDALMTLDLFVKNSVRPNFYIRQEKKTAVLTLQVTVTLIMHAILEEVAVDWPLFLYLALTSCFSICFLRDRRTESRALKQMNEQLEYRLTNRFRRLEYLIENANTVSLTNGDPYRQSRISELSADEPTREREKL